MNPITPVTLREWRACYSDAEIAATFTRCRLDPGGADPLRLSRARSIPVRDRVWVLLRAIGPAAAGRVARRAANRAVRKHALRCGVPAVESWARDWLSGADTSVASARVASARASAYASASAVAYASASAVAYASAYASADAVACADRAADRAVAYASASAVAALADRALADRTLADRTLADIRKEIRNAR